MWVCDVMQLQGLATCARERAIGGGVGEDGERAMVGSKGEEF